MNDSLHLLVRHTSKWSDVCHELEEKYPKSDAMLYVHGYVFGLRHAVAMMSRSISGAVDARTRYAANQQCTSREPLNKQITNS